MQSVLITTNIVSLNPAHGDVYLIEHYMINFFSDLRQVGGFLWVLQFLPPMKLTSTSTLVIRKESSDSSHECIILDVIHHVLIKNICTCAV